MALPIWAQLLVCQLGEKALRAYTSTAMHPVAVFALASLGTALVALWACLSSKEPTHWPRLATGVAILALDAVADVAYVLSYTWSGVQVVEVLSRARLVFAVAIAAIATREWPTARRVGGVVCVVCGCALYILGGGKGTKGARPVMSETLIPETLALVSGVAVEAAVYLERHAVHRERASKSAVRLMTSAFAPLLLPTVSWALPALHASVWPHMTLPTELAPFCGVVAICVANHLYLSTKMTAHHAGMPATEHARLQLVVFMTTIGATWWYTDPSVAIVSTTRLVGVLALMCTGIWLSQ